MASDGEEDASGGNIPPLARRPLLGGMNPETGEIRPAIDDSAASRDAFGGSHDDL